MGGGIKKMKKCDKKCYKCALKDNSYCFYEPEYNILQIILNVSVFLCIMLLVFFLKG